MATKVYTTSQLKQVLKDRCEKAVKDMQVYVFKTIQDHLYAFYAEFSPEYYRRTYQLFKSLVKSEIQETPNGYKAEVYFDLSKLDYSKKRIGGFADSNTLSGHWYSNTFHRQPWTHDNDIEVFKLAAYNGYTHGGYTGFPDGTSVWQMPIEEITGEAHYRLKSALKKAGIPVR